MVDSPHGRDVAATTAAPTFPTLPQDLTVCTAAETRQQWLAWWDAGGQATVGAVQADAAAVDCVDGAGVQLLVALHHWLSHHGLALRLTRPSEPLRAACAATGLSSLLSDPATA